MTRRAAPLLLLVLLAAGGCQKDKAWTLQGTVDSLIGDFDSVFGASTLPGKHLAAIRSVHEKKSWNFAPDAEDALDTTRRAVRGLATCDYASWAEGALVVEIVSSMADEHVSSLVRAEALDTLTRMGPWTLRAVVAADRPSTKNELIDGIKVLREAIDRKDIDPALAFQVAGAVDTLATYPFDKVEAGAAPVDATDNRAAARAAGDRLRTARGALRTINGKGLEPYQADPAVREALDRAYVALSASVIRLTLEKAALGDVAETTRVAAVRDLGTLRPEGGAATLGRALSADSYASVRREAAKSLAGFPVESGFPLLVSALNDEMADVRSAAARSLADVTGQAFGDDRAAWVKWWQARSANGAAPSAAPGGGTR